uniref:Reverse transcriptase domain-containing protein n=1 Tax=Scylla olivacea TaxID=85551 RepID=A0A0P4VZ67_SCYOL
MRSNLVPPDKGDPTNYRPISLLSTVSKILERIISEQLTCHMEEHHPNDNTDLGRDAPPLTCSSYSPNPGTTPSTLAAPPLSSPLTSLWRLIGCGTEDSWPSLSSSVSRGSCWSCSPATCKPESEGGGEQLHLGHAPGGNGPQGLILGPILWNVYFNDFLQRLSLTSANVTLW